VTATTTTTHAKAGRRKFWQRWFVDPVVKQLTQGVTPQKIALSLAIGSALALFPILGTTTTLCVIAGIAMKLNQPIIQGVNALCTFIYFPLMLAFVRIGDAIAGGPASNLNIPVMISMATHQPKEFLAKFGVTALHAMLGWVVVMPLWLPAIYFLALPPLRVASRRLSKR
jgi:uncharacterized protein (DUF2062 family)